MLFLVKGKVELDDHDGQHQQSNNYSYEGDEETWRWKIRSYFIFVFLLLCGRGTAGWALPKESVVLEGEEGCTLALRCVICLVGDVMVVAEVVNSLRDWVCTSGSLTVSEETTLPSVGDASADVSVCGNSLQMTSEILVPVIFAPNLHLQRMKGGPRVRNTVHCWALFWNHEGWTYSFHFLQGELIDLLKNPGSHSVHSGRQRQNIVKTNEQHSVYCHQLLYLQTLYQIQLYNDMWKSLRHWHQILHGIYISCLMSLCTAARWNSQNLPQNIQTYVYMFNAIMSHSY